MNTQCADQTFAKISIPDSLFKIDDESCLLKVNPKVIVDWSTAVIITTIWGECHVCMAKFKEWEKIRGKEPFKDLQVVYIVTTPYPDYFLKVFYPEIKHSGILLIDDSDSFYSLNNLKYSQAHLNTFLVDSTLSIILQGDPLVMPGMLEQYEKAIKSYLDN
ncbi:hypothetical protein [Perlabentimonas gracilis]|uniref:hypothetical protein n=1 Tax=Perlabentimonas gracilis TaxID=2715279 RepID=UPI00140D79F7|nr:hypothetical protein [Perlabentimonas gracilis]NHB70127.1 hypothetical protein [Perlabentimonas gracilis]